MVHPAHPKHSKPLGPGDHVFLVDGSSFVFRAFFQSIRQDPKYNFRSDKLPTGAVRLFCAKLLQFVRDGAAGIKPTHLAIIFDKSENSFRKALYPPYKSNRSAPPEELIPQFPLMRESVRAFGLQPIEQDRYEADDLIATYARHAREKGADVLIISADKDLMQLIEPGVAMYDPASGERDERKIGPDEVVDYFGVPPNRVVDVQSLAGDSTDHVPGAPGIGIKTAAQLITEYGDLDNLLKNAHQIKQPKRRETLTDPKNIELIKVSKQLVTLVRDVEVEVSLDETRLNMPEVKKLISFLKAMEFTTLTKRAADIFNADAEHIDADPDFIGAGGWRDRNGQKKDIEVHDAQDASLDVTQSKQLTLHEKHIQSARQHSINYDQYETITDITQLKKWIELINARGYVCVDTETSALDAMQADLIGISLAIDVNKACYIPIGHRKGGDKNDLFIDSSLVEGQIALDDVVHHLKPILESASILKIAQNAKYDWLVLSQHGITLNPIDDTMLMSYVLDAGINRHGMDELSVKYLGHQPISFSDVAGSGKNFIGFARVPIDQATRYAAEDADVTLRLWHILKSRLTNEHMTYVYESLERSMPSVLARMEQRGISIDPHILSRLSHEFSQTMARLEEDIYSLAGEKFNLASPKQLGDILFGKMNMPGGKKTATGAWSTSAQILDDLAEQGFELAARILEWRQLAKLKSTYTDALPDFINPHTKRIHTSFSLAATTTGRLSSSDPNIQNIPVRNEEGRKIRKAFIARKGFHLISADYSQIELRLLAHIADIKQLKKAFSDGIDIHAMTASEMFNVPLKDMTSDIRRRAKAINFGIIYGISAFGLANQLGISREEAAHYIRTYFERFPGIRDYMEAIKVSCRQNGYVTTIFGRKCHYPQITSSNAAERAFNERAAINAPIQGSAADIIRRAMIRMDDALQNHKLQALMLLQVHDELIFEVPDHEIDETLSLVKNIMSEAASPALRLSVPLQVDAKAALNWDEAH
jgi:DNA polymerase-1